MKRFAQSLAFACLAGTVFSGYAHEEDAAASPPRFGTVSFPTSCSPEVQSRFDRAVAILHSFWYPAAEKAFLDVAKSDPACAMAFWGVAMTYYHQIWAPPTATDLQKGAEAVRQALDRNARTQRERDYIAAIAGFYKDPDKTDHGARARAYEMAMDQLHRKYPDDTEAAVFHALALEAAAPPTDKTYAQQKMAARILEELAPLLPDHPGVVHYLIHAYDYPPLAELGLPAARRYASIAPSSAHALHMPSHIFIRLGLWDEAIKADSAAAAVALKNGNALNPGVTTIEQLHSMDYLMYAYLQGAQDGKARAVLDQRNAIGKVSQQTITSAYALAAIPARYALERRQWKEAAALTVQPADFPWERFPYAEAITHFARAMGAIHTGELASAENEVSRLGQLRDALATRDEYWASQVEIERKTVTAWLAFAKGSVREAVDLMRAAAEQEDASEKNSVTPGPVIPARDLLGDLLLENRQPGEALSAYEASLAIAPNRFSALSGAVRAAEFSNEPAKASHFRKLLTQVSSNAEGDRSSLVKVGR